MRDRWLLAEADAARYLLVDRLTFAAMVDAGVVPYVVDFDGTVKYSRIDLEQARTRIDFPWGRLSSFFNE
jgi:hypothetical protein